MTDTRLHQIDVLKGLAALSVVVTHSLSVEELIGSWAVFHVWQAVPVFIVLTAVNASISFGRQRARGAAHLFTATYVRRRGSRILIPFAVAWLFALLIGMRGGDLRFGPETLLLQLPHPGPGNYYVSLALALTAIAPLVYVGYRRRPGLTLGALFAIDIAFELLAAQTSAFITHPFLYSVAFPRYLAVFGLGFFIVDERVSNRLKWTVLVAGSAFSVVYLLLGNSGAWAPPFLATWRTQNVLAAFYPALLVALGSRYIAASSNNWLYRGLTLIGRASYHVFLAQMVYFMVVPQSKSETLVLNLVVCTLLGVGFYYALERTKASPAR